MKHIYKIMLILGAISSAHAMKDYEGSLGNASKADPIKFKKNMVNKLEDSQVPNNQNPKREGLKRKKSIHETLSSGLSNNKIFKGSLEYSGASCAQDIKPSQNVPWSQYPTTENWFDSLNSDQLGQSPAPASENFDDADKHFEETASSTRAPLPQEVPEWTIGNWLDFYDSDHLEQSQSPAQASKLNREEPNREESNTAGSWPAYLEQLWQDPLPAPENFCYAETLLSSLNLLPQPPVTAKLKKIEKAALRKQAKLKKLEKAELRKQANLKKIKQARLDRTKKVELKSKEERLEKSIEKIKFKKIYDDCAKGRLKIKDATKAQGISYYTFQNKVDQLHLPSPRNIAKMSSEEIYKLYVTNVRLTAERASKALGIKRNTFYENLNKGKYPLQGNIKEDKLREVHHRYMKKEVTSDEASTLLNVVPKVFFEQLRRLDLPLWGNVDKAKFIEVYDNYVDGYLTKMQAWDHLNMNKKAFLRYARYICLSSKPSMF